MIVSLDVNKMNSTMSIPHMHSHSPAPSVNMYAGSNYMLDWHGPLNVKQEIEDSNYNNDSGVSPSHFSENNTSPMSYRSEGQSSSVDSGNPEKSYRPSPPRDETDKDSTVQTNATIGILARPILSMSPPRQSTTPEFSRSPAVKPAEDSRSSTSDAEGGVYEEDPLRRLQMALQKTGMMGPGPMAQPENVVGEKPLQCPLCDFASLSRSDFNNHLKTHSSQVNCPHCDFTADNTDKLRDHLQDVHNTNLEDEAIRWADDEEPGVTTPKINSQGKVKTYRCKQCDYTAVTKLDFWDHSRQHIKTERLLTCPKCPFVTEYKHHLEYHLRNHFGSKPFKCDKCPYTCVNKSMLNSHLKSHSTVYQFRCANCTYATKYCHSLKLHLRKYNHTPAMVLNPDGTPNPLPIVDVYGTRRGPKNKLGKCDENMPASPPSQLPQSSPPVFPPPFAFMPNPNIPYPMGAMMNAFPTMNPVYARSPPLQEEHLPMDHVDHTVFGINNNKEGVKEYFARVIAMQQEIIARTQSTVEPEDSARVPLDLSRSDSQSEQATKNRRKGKAFKLERIAQQLQHQTSDDESYEHTPKKQKRLSSEDEQYYSSSEQENKPSPCAALPPLAKSPSPVPESSISESEHTKVNFCEPKNNEFKSTISNDRKDRWRNVKEIYDCAYCDLLFGDVIMYTMHMGYHGYQNPFTCNMCGEETSDRVQFFLHLFRFNHG